MRGLRVQFRDNDRVLVVLPLSSGILLLCCVIDFPAVK